jgi:rhamnogalacturonan endolyase
MIRLRYSAWMWLAGPLLWLGCGADSGSNDGGSGGTAAIGGGPGADAVGGSGPSGNIGGAPAGGAAPAVGGGTLTGGGPNPGTGGASTTGGSTASGGVTASGGAQAVGGNTSSGGASPTGGSTASGGAVATGGTAQTGGTSAAGGTTATGGTVASGGSAGTGGEPATSELATCRGVMAVAVSGGAYVGWRFKATDPQALAFNVYRDDTLVNATPITDSTNLVDPGGSAGSSYTVRPVLDGVEQGESAAFVAWAQDYLTIPLVNSTGQAGRLVGTADLDGDCDYDFVVKYSNNDQDVTQAADQGLPNETIKLEAYTNDGQFLWYRDLGPNIDTGVWFSPITVFDFDGDGRAEVALKASEVATADGGDGDINGDGVTDYSSSTGEFYANEHPDVEFLEVWDGATGATLARAPWVDVGPWGSDGYRYNRNMIAPAYLDGTGQNPSIIIMRGGNERTTIEAYDFDGATLTRRWDLTRAPNGGNYGHNVRLGDMDDDGRDELLYFTVAVDDDGTELWNTQQAHGDRVHMTDLIPDRPGMEIFYIQEFADVYDNPISVREAATGALIWGPTGDWGDVGRGLAANIDPNSPGVEVWASSGELYSPTGTVLGPRPNTPNMAIWWDADRERELLDGTRVSKYGGGTLLDANGCVSGTRNIPMGYGDILGDWREEVWWTCNGHTELRIYVSTEETDYRMYSLMQDPEYRTSVGCLMMGYVQATQPSYYVGSDMSPPPAPRIAIPPGQ